MDDTPEPPNNSNLGSYIGGGLGGLMSLVTVILGFIHRKKLQKSCFGKTFTVSIEDEKKDIETGEKVESKDDDKNKDAASTST
jgi:hypothetical protein